MMFTVERVELNNFRSYVGNHAFEIPAAPGLFNLTGTNLLNPEVGANATGKSSLLDAIFWALYGRSTRGLKAGDVVSWSAKGCAVAVTLTVGDKRSLVRRTQNPNSLTLTDNDPTSGDAQPFFPQSFSHPIDQSSLEKYLRLTPEAFLYSVILPQFGESFFDLSPAAKLALFSDIMELDYWLERSQAADKLATDLANERGVRGLAVSRAEGQRETIKADLDKLREKEANFADLLASEIKLMEDDLRELVKDAKSAEAELKYIRNVLVDLEGKAGKLAAKNTCPTCKQPVPNADLKAIRQNIVDFEGKLRRYERDNPKKQITDLQTAIAKEVKRTNPYSEMISEKVQLAIKLKGQLKDLGAEIDKLNEEHTAVSFWVGGFKRVRLFIVESALQQLELEVNNNLASLGLMGWHIGFDVERENKSGGITKGFIVLVTPPGAEEPVRYESFSGGETQRLRLAGDLGLANLIMERAGLVNTLEIYDEPSRHLSQEGLLDLAETLAVRATAQGKVILLVDHNAVDFAFQGTFTIVKDGAGSRFG